MVVDHIFTHSTYVSNAHRLITVCQSVLILKMVSEQPMPFIGYKIVIKVLDRGEEINSLPINTYTNFTDYIGNYPAIENLSVIQELAVIKETMTQN